MADRVAIWIEKADVGNRHGVQTALSAGFANQAVDLKTLGWSWFFGWNSGDSEAVTISSARTRMLRLRRSSPGLGSADGGTVVADSELVAFRVGHQDPGAAVLAAGLLPDTLGAEHGEPGRFDANVWGLDVKVHPVLGLLDIVELSVMLPTSCRVHVRAEGHEGSGSMGEEGVAVYLERSRLRFTGCATEGVDWWPNRDLHEP